MTVNDRNKSKTQDNQSLTIDEVFSVIPDLIFLLDHDHKILEYRAGNFSDLYLPPNEFLGQSMCKVLPPDVAASIKEAINKCLSSDVIQLIEYELEVHGESKWFEARVSHSTSDRVIMLVRDISELKRKQESIIYQSNHDPLTSLYNRAFAIDYLNQKLKEASRNKIATSVFFIDVDDFKKINDQYGHEFGDKVLISVANAITKTVRKKDLVARFGGDEFIVVLEDINNNQSLELVAKKFFNQLGEQENKLHLPISVSIGISSCQNGNVSSNKLISQADIAMYESKNQGKHTVSIFTPNMKVGA